MKQLVVLGASGHAKVIIDMLQDAGEVEIVGCTSADLADAGTSLLGIPVLGDDCVLPKLHAAGVSQAFVAVGDNRLRGKLMREVAALGFELANAISPHATISRRAKLGVGVAAMPGAIVNTSSEIGDGCIVNTGATVDHDCVLGPCVHVAPGTNLAGCVTLGEGVFLGTGARVIPKITVGPWAIVGAGAVIIEDIPGYVTAVGVPAAIIAAHGGEER
jgi:UDP-perosamine 4-acetyltransferase